jgi:hypothetical protein
MKSLELIGMVMVAWSALIGGIGIFLVILGKTWK